MRLPARVSISLGVFHDELYVGTMRAYVHGGGELWLYLPHRAYLPLLLKLLGAE